MLLPSLYWRTATAAAAGDEDPRPARRASTTAPSGPRRRVGGPRRAGRRSQRGAPGGLLDRVDYAARDVDDDPPWARSPAASRRCAPATWSTTCHRAAPLCPDLRGTRLRGPGDRGTRVVLEKPIGHDLASAIAINDGVVAGISTRNRVFRIDHYLGKEGCRTSGAALRQRAVRTAVARPATSPRCRSRWPRASAWSRRGDYYDGSGAMRDMLQNHLLQLLCIVGDGAARRRSTRTPCATKNSRCCARCARWHRRGRRPHRARPVHRRRGAAAKRCRAIAGRAAPRTAAPRPSSRVRPTSTTGAGPACRSSCVPASAAGRLSEIVIEFRDAAVLDLRRRGAQAQPNRLVIRLQPEESIQLHPDDQGARACGMRLLPVRLNLDLDRAFTNVRAEAYERLLMDAIADNGPCSCAATRPKRPGTGSSPSSTAGKPLTRRPRPTPPAPGARAAASALMAPTARLDGESCRRWPVDAPSAADADALAGAACRADRGAVDAGLAASRQRGLALAGFGRHARRRFPRLAAAAASGWPGRVTVMPGRRALGARIATPTATLRWCGSTCCRARPPPPASCRFFRRCTAPQGAALDAGSATHSGRAWPTCPGRWTWPCWAWASTATSPRCFPARPASTRALDPEPGRTPPDHARPDAGGRPASAAEPDTGPLLRARHVLLAITGAAKRAVLDRAQQGAAVELPSRCCCASADPHAPGRAIETHRSPLEGPPYPAVERVTARIRERSAPPAAPTSPASTPPAKPGTAAHAAVAAETSPTASPPAGARQAAAARGAAPNIGIVTAYNDMLSAHQPIRALSRADQGRRARASAPRRRSPAACPRCATASPRAAPAWSSRCSRAT